MTEKSLTDRLLNAAERINDGLEPREHCANLMLEAYKRIEALGAQVNQEDIKILNKYAYILEENGFDGADLRDVADHISVMLSLEETLNATP